VASGIGKKQGRNGVNVDSFVLVVIRFASNRRAATCP
jgi:hypothetical protein